MAGRPHHVRAGAIVNAANAEMLGCWVPGHTCIDNVIHAVAGPGLRAECAAYMEGRAGHPEETGRALLTNGYHLPAEHVIHTVGPIVEGEVTEKHRMLLASSYRSVLDLAAEAGWTRSACARCPRAPSATPRRRLRRSCLSVIGPVVGCAPRGRAAHRHLRLLAGGCGRLREGPDPISQVLSVP